MRQSFFSHNLSIYASFLAACFALFAGSATAGSGDCFIDPQATGANTGDSWLDAYTDIQSAFEWEAACSQFYLAEGVYTPSSTGDRTAYFQIKRSKEFYGGYAGGSPLPVHDPLAHPTVFSGDIDHNDFVDSRGVTMDADDIVGGNSYHIVWIGDDPWSVYGNEMHDIIITGGKADGAVFPDNAGGGVYCDSGTPGNPQHCNTKYSKMQFIGNFAQYGGAVYLDGRYGRITPLFRDSSFIGNEAGISGGAVYFEGDFIDPPYHFRARATGSTFANNRAAYGGAFYLDAYDGGSAAFYGSYNTFVGNHASEAGGTFYIDDENNGVVDFSFVNSILADSTAPVSPYIFAGVSGSPALIEKTVMDAPCPPGVTCTDWVQGDPMLGPLSFNGGSTPNFLPALNSPALEQVPCVEPQTYHIYDQRGVERPRGIACDVGSVERNVQTLSGWMTDYSWYSPEGNIAIFRLKIFNHGNVDAVGITIAFDGLGWYNPAVESWDCRGFRGSPASSQGSGVMVTAGLSIPVGAYIECVIKAWRIPTPLALPHDAPAGEADWAWAEADVIDMYGTRGYHDLGETALFQSDFGLPSVEDF